MVPQEQILSLTAAAVMVEMVKKGLTAGQQVME